MDSDWAAENLRTIRTLMERSTVYRRALAPIMLWSGAVGTAAAAAGIGLHVEDLPGFGFFWFGVAALALAGAFVIARRQAFKDQDPFWSPPTRRVAQALLPALTAGFLTALLLALERDDDLRPHFVLVCLFFYGAALHAAGFFMPRGIKLLGWLFIGGGALCLALIKGLEPDLEARDAHLVMGLFFGLLQLAYGGYVSVTGRRGPSV